MFILYTGRKTLELTAVALVVWVVGTDFGPEGVGMVHVIDVGELV